MSDASAPIFARSALGAGADVVAVCLLHSYANPAHEQAVARWLRAAGCLVCASHEVLPEYREYERWSTTVVNAYVTPLMDRYLGRLERALGGSRLAIMQSNGGSISAVAASGGTSPWISHQSTSSSFAISGSPQKPWSTPLGASVTTHVDFCPGRARYERSPSTFFGWSNRARKD